MLLAYAYMLLSALASVSILFIPFYFFSKARKQEKIFLFLTILFSLILSLVIARELRAYTIPATAVFSCAYGFLLLYLHRSRKISFQDFIAIFVFLNVWLANLPWISLIIREKIRIMGLEMPRLHDSDSIIVAAFLQIILAFVVCLFTIFAGLNIKRYGLEGDIDISHRRKNRRNHQEDQ